MSGWRTSDSNSVATTNIQLFRKLTRDGIRWSRALLVVLACGLCVPGIGFGQEEESDPPRTTKPKTEPPKAKFSVTEVELKTKDGFPLKATWYEGDKGTSAAALLMLHDLGRNRKDFEALATFFADNGHCVLVPDLRGHGASLNDASGNPYEPKKYGPAESMALQADIEACKKFLVQKNDAEVCNIELMSIVVCGVTSIPALQWCVVDWSYLPAAVKQGQDVKAVVLLGLVRSHQSLQINPLLKLPLLSGAGHPQPLELLFISGEKSRSFRDTKSVYSSWAVSRGRKDEADDWKKHNIYLLTTDSAHDGIDSVMQHTDIVPDAIFDFLENRVMNRAEEYGHKIRSSGKPSENRPVAPGGIAPGKNAPGNEAEGKGPPG